MPVLAPAVTAAIIAAGPTLKGPSWFKITSAVGTAVATWLKLGPASHMMIGSSNGTLGAGKTTGKVIVLPVVPAVTGTFAAAGLVGPTAFKMAPAIAIGVSNAINTGGLYQGTAAGCGVGVDVNKVTYANSGTLIPLLVGNFASRGLVGASSAKLATAIGNGVALIVMTGFGTGAVTGPTGPLPGTGVSTSFIT